MTDDTFDPFDLPATFDPLAPVAPAPPRRRRSMAGAGSSQGCGALPPTAGAGDRLAHLLAPPMPTKAVPTGDAGARLTALEDEVAILKALLGDLMAVVDHKLANHQDRLLRAVTTLVEQRRHRR